MRGMRGMHALVLYTLLHPLPTRSANHSSVPFMLFRRGDVGMEPIECMYVYNCLATVSKKNEECS